ncbi:MAG: hypothetical protein QHC90_13310 [Shinella sp.]|nr:hypothetical protein [Shinella sp.]
MSDREPGVTEYLSHYTAFINARPMLISLLYDIDMLPEQTVTQDGAIRLGGLCEVWRMGEEGKLLPPSQESTGE